MIKKVFILSVAILLAGGFLFFIYSIFPFGVFLAIIGGGLATHGLHRYDKSSYLVGVVGGWLYPIGVIYTFIKTGVLWGVVSIILGFLAYRYGKYK